MSLYVLDTDILTLYRRNHPVVVSRIDAQPPDELAITVMSVEEQLSGWYRMLRRARQPDKLAAAYEELAEATAFLGGWRILSFPLPAIARYRQLCSLKLNVGKADLRSAAIALEFGATVVTRNLHDFQRVPNLTVEDWSV
jgi:tRNA(fMet)-specific endonuclease VapC